MADTNITKQVILSLKTDASRAASEMKQLERQFRDTTYQQKLQKAAGDENKIALLQQARAVQEAREAHKAYQQQLKDLTDEQERNKNSSERMWKSVALGTLAADATKAALRGVKDSLVGLLKSGRDWIDDVGGKMTPALERLKVASGNMIQTGDLARMREMGEQLGWTTRELDAVTKAAIQYGRVARIDNKQAIQELTDALISGKVAALRKVGITMDEVSGDKTTKMHAALGLLVKNFGNTKVSIMDASEQLDSMAVSWKDFTGQLGLAIINTKLVQNTLGELPKLFDAVTASTNKARRELLVYGDDIEFFTRRLPGLNAAAQALAQARAALAPQLQSSEQRERLTEQYTKQAEDMNQRLVNSLRTQSDAKRKKTSGSKGSKEGFDSGFWNESQSMMKEVTAARIQAEKESIAAIYDARLDAEQSELVKLEESKYKLELSLESKAQGLEKTQSAQRISILRQRTNAERTLLQAQWKAERTEREKAYKLEIASAEGNEKKIWAIKQKYARINQQAKYKQGSDLRKLEAREGSESAKIQKEEYDEKKKQLEGYASAFLNVAVSSILSAKSAGDAMAMMAKAGLEALSNWALQQAAVQAAEAIAAAASMNFPGAALHASAAAAFTLAALGTGAAAASINTGASGGGGSSYGNSRSNYSSGSSSYGSSSGGSSSESGSSKSVTNINFVVKGGPINTKLAKREMQKLLDGRGIL